MPATKHVQLIIDDVVFIDAQVGDDWTFAVGQDGATGAFEAKGHPRKTAPAAQANPFAAWSQAAQQHTASSPM